MNKKQSLWAQNWAKTLRRAGFEALTKVRMSILVFRETLKITTSLGRVHSISHTRDGNFLRAS